MSGGLVALVVRRPVATLMVAIALAVFGFVSYLRLPLNLMPDLSYPAITVRTEAEGYAPEEVESQVSRPVEEALATTQGLVELESRSRAGVSDVVLDFDWGTDMDQAAQEIRESLQTTLLPDDASRPLILRYDPTQDPILRIGLSYAPDPGEPVTGPAALYMLRETAEQELKRDLEAMDGIAAVRVRGGLEREVLVEAREDWLAARGVTIDQVVAVLGAENINIPGGSIRDGDNEYLVRTLNEVRSVEEISAIEVRRSDGTRVPLSEVATVREAHKDREVVSRLDGGEAVELEVFKSADANIVRVSQDVRDRLGIDAAPPGPAQADAGPGGTPLVGKTISSRLPAGVKMVVLEDQSRFIEASIDNLKSTAILGALLAVGVLFLFLRDFRSTAIIAMAIPLSIVWTFAPMYVGGVSLNLMSLGGLALGVGMLVDNAVVVLENIQVLVERGVNRRDAAVDGTREVAAAVTASTLTTVCVFLPIAFVEGIAGQIFGDLALAVVFSLLASLVVALFFVPMLAAIHLAIPVTGRPPLLAVSPAARFKSFALLRASWRSRSGRARLVRLPIWLARFLVRLSFELVAALFVYPFAVLARVVAGLTGFVVRPMAAAAMWSGHRFHDVYDGLADRYDGWLPGLLRRPGTVLGLAAAATAVAVVVGGGLGQALIPELHQGRFTAEVALPVGTPLMRTAEVVAAAEEKIRALPGVAHVHSIVGTERRADSRPDEGEHSARIMVELVPLEQGLGRTFGPEPAEREADVMADVRAVLVEAGRNMGLGSVDRVLQARMTRPSLFSFATPIEVRLYDNDLDRLRDVAQRVRERLEELPGLRDLRSSLVSGYPEVRIQYDRTLLHRLGLDTSTVAKRVREKVQGERASTVARGDGRIDLVVRLDEADRRDVDDLRRLNVNPQIIPPIPLEVVATLSSAVGPSEVRRIDQRRAVAVTANLDGFDVAGQAAAVRAALAGVDLEGVEWEMAGQNREMERSLVSLLYALLLAVFLVYVIMASTFESVLHPFVILFSVPLAVVGVVFALWATSVPISVVVLIGAIVLAGVVVNNAIVLVDTVNRVRDSGVEREEAIRRGAHLRLRPILITTTTTVLGLLPLAFGLGEGAEIQQPLALTIIAGLSSATLLTLVVIPVVYLVLTRALERRPEPEATPALEPEP